MKGGRNQQAAAEEEPYESTQKKGFHISEKTNKEVTK